ncbi:MAG: hypothetical protein LBG13_02550 [Holosporales bacterium]|jgi:hypothetical protein|nr:hypothetical protein [Holosporales bacterium]
MINLKHLNFINTFKREITNGLALALLSIAAATGQVDDENQTPKEAPTTPASIEQLNSLHSLDNANNASSIARPNPQRPSIFNNLHEHSSPEAFNENDIQETVTPPTERNLPTPPTTPLANRQLQLIPPIARTGHTAGGIQPSQGYIFDPLRTPSPTSLSTSPSTSPSPPPLKDFFNLDHANPNPINPKGLSANDQFLLSLQEEQVDQNPDENEVSSDEEEGELSRQRLSNKEEEFICWQLEENREKIKRKGSESPKDDLCKNKKSNNRKRRHGSE